MKAIQSVSLLWTSDFSKGYLACVFSKTKGLNLYAYLSWKGKGRKRKITMYYELVYKIIVLRKGKFDHLGVFPCPGVK